MNNLRNCFRCGRWFNPTNEHQIICDPCHNRMDDRLVTYWFVALAIGFLAVLVWYFFKE